MQKMGSGTVGISGCRDVMFNPRSQKREESPKMTLPFVKLSE